MSRRGLSGGMAKNLLGNVVGPVAGLASAPIIALSLGVDGRGEVAAATAPFLLLATLAAVGVPEAVTFYVARDPRLARLVGRRATALIVAFGAGGTAIGLLLAPLMTLSEPHLTLLVASATAAIIPTIMVGLLRGLAAGKGNWGRVALERAVGPLVRLLSVVVLAAAGELTVLTATIAIVASPLVGAIAYIPVSRARSAHSRPTPTMAPTIGTIAGYGSRVWIGAIAGVLLMRIDQVLLVPLGGTYQLGLYVVAVTISELPLIVNTAIREVMFAADARSSSNDRLALAARVSLLICLLVAVALGVSAPVWLPILFGRGFEAALPTLWLLLGAVVVGVPGSIAGSGLSARGLPQLRSYSILLALSINVIVVVIAVPALGALGAALGTLVGNVVSSNTNVLQMRARFGTSFWSFYAVRFSDIRAIAVGIRKLFRRP